MSKLVEISVELLNYLKGSGFTLEEYKRIYSKTNRNVKFGKNIHTLCDCGSPIPKTERVKSKLR